MWKFIPGVKNPKEVKKDESKLKKMENDRNYDTKKRQRKFLPKWKDDFCWLIHKEDDHLGLMFCASCVANSSLAESNCAYVKGSNNFQYTSLKSHDDSEKHKITFAIWNAQKESANGEISSSEAHRALLLLNTAVAEKMCNLFRTAHALAKNARPFSDFKWQCELDIAKGVDVGETYHNDKSCRQFVYFIAKVEKQKLLSDLNKAKCFSLIIDETTDASVTEQVIMFVRYVLINTGEIIVKMLSIENVIKADAASIIEVIHKTFHSIGMSNWESKLAGFGSDGAAVMTGRNNGVAAQLKRNQPILQSVHCAAHRLELAVKSVITDVNSYEKVDGFLLSIYLFYCKSTLNRNLLKTSCEAVKVKFLVPSRVGGTRWVAHVLRALKHVIAIYPGLVTHLQQLQTEKTQKAAKAKGFLKLLLNANFVQFIHYLADVLEILTIASEQIQKSNTSIVDMRESIEDACASLRQLKFNSGHNLRKIKNQTEFHGYKLILDKQTFPNTSETIQEEILDRLVKNLEARFGELDDELLKAAAKILKLSEWPDDEMQLQNYGIDDLHTILKKFQDTATNFLPDSESFGRIQIEWTGLKNHVLRRYKNPSMASWKNLMKETHEKFPNLLCFVSYFLTLPAHSADCERGFSTLKRVKTDWRASLSNNSLVDLMVIKLHSASIASFNPKPAVELWLTDTQRERRMTQIPSGPRKIYDDNDSSDSDVNHDSDSSDMDNSNEHIVSPPLKKKKI